MSKQPSRDESKSKAPSTSANRSDKDKSCGCDQSTDKPESPPDDANGIDEASQESFPASDPPAHTPVVGVGPPKR